MRKSPARKRLAAMLLLAAGLSSTCAFGQKSSDQDRGLKDTGTAAAVQPGPYYALVIGNNNYRYLSRLQTAVNDAKAIAALLEGEYGFTHKKLLLDATRDDILTAVAEYRRALPENSNLLIYYAGHGHHDRDTDEAYWLPVDAQPDNPDHWISANDITTNIRAIPAKHVLIISDSCYSGVLTRGVDVAINPLKPDAYLTKMLGSKSRNLMSSGGDEPVADVGPEGHSVFANAVLKSLKEMEDQQFTAADLFQKFIKRAVAGRSDQVPQYSFIRNSGDEYGDFVFSRGDIVKEWVVDFLKQRHDLMMQIIQNMKDEPADFAGEWRNDNAQTRGISRIEIFVRGSGVVVHAWSACSPQDCDWGTKTGTMSGNSVSVVWDENLVSRNMTLTRDGARLLMELESTYKDGRPPEHRKEYFVKSK